VHYFARLRDTLGLASEQIELPEHARSVTELTQWLRQRSAVWDKELGPGRPIRVAINQVVVNPDTPIREGDEVAYFPPVTGG
jgi:molybdopterin synthase sulfur carrier subunit